MLDPKFLRSELDLDHVILKLKTRGFEIDSLQLIALETQRKSLQIRFEQLKNERNQHSKRVGQAKAAGQAIESLLATDQSLKTALEEAEKAFTDVENQLQEIMVSIPNLPHESVPMGLNETENIEIRRYGEPKKFDFDVRDHVAIGELHNWLDFEAATRLTASRFVVMRQPCAKLHRALIQFMLDFHTEKHGYQEMYIPYIVNDKTLFGTGQLPKFLDDQFALAGDQSLYLIPTAEVPLTNLVADKVLYPDELPIKLVAHTPCFRREAGSYGKDTRGMIRQHQFEKVELVWIVKPSESYQALETLTSDAEAILQQLELPYRVLSLCTGDIGFSASKTYDLEVWLPSQNTYREISSCSNTEDFQARRMQARWRDPDYKKPQLVHTLNGSGVAIGRCLIAILENYQTTDGDVMIPRVLQPYLRGKQTLSSLA